jgi:RNA-binding protein Tab2/Atab2
MSQPPLNPPVPMPEDLWGDRWQFASLPSGDLWDSLSGRMTPIQSLPESAKPFNLGLASDIFIPGVIITGGRKAMAIARWLQSIQPHGLTYQSSPGSPSGLILQAGERDRYILATFDDADVQQAGEIFQQRQQAAQGLHFLLIQPDDSGMTHSGVWLLQSPSPCTVVD